MFSNLDLGPVVSIDNHNDYQDTIDSVLLRGFIPIAYITDKTHQAFELFEHPEGVEPAGMFITVKYLRNYE